MNKRKLKDGTEVDSFDHPIDLIIHTKAPAKWLVIDLEMEEWSKETKQKILLSALVIAAAFVFFALI